MQGKLRRPPCRPQRYRLAKIRAPLKLMHTGLLEKICYRGRLSAKYWCRSHALRALRYKFVPPLLRCAYHSRKRRHACAAHRTDQKFLLAEPTKFHVLCPRVHSVHKAVNIKSNSQPLPGSQQGKCHRGITAGVARMFEAC